MTLLTCRLGFMRTVSILVQLLAHTYIIDILIARAWHGILDLRCTCRTGLVFCYLAVGSIVFTFFYTLDTLLVRYRGINLTLFLITKDGRRSRRCLSSPAAAQGYLIVPSQHCPWRRLSYAPGGCRRTISMAKLSVDVAVFPRIM